MIDLFEHLEFVVVVKETCELTIIDVASYDQSPMPPFRDV